MLDNLKKYQIILASGSPRRKELMDGLGINYKIKLLPDIDESYPDTLQGEEIPLYICRKKAAAYQSVILPDELIITADTIVWLEDTVLGKPTSDPEAVDMLKRLSGKQHQVITGVCLTTPTGQQCFSVVTEVTFTDLSEEEITYYVSHYHPLDKAGAYGIQEWIGFVGVQKIKGSYFNVMGLPIQKLYQELKHL